MDDGQLDAQKTEQYLAAAQSFSLIRGVLLEIASEGVEEGRWKMIESGCFLDLMRNGFLEVKDPKVFFSDEKGMAIGRDMVRDPTKHFSLTKSGGLVAACLLRYLGHWIEELAMGEERSDGRPKPGPCWFLHEGRWWAATTNGSGTTREGREGFLFRAYVVESLEEEEWQGPVPVFGYAEQFKTRRFDDERPEYVPERGMG